MNRRERREGIGRHGDVGYMSYWILYALEKAFFPRGFLKINRNKISFPLIDMRVFSNYYFNIVVNNLVQYMAHVTLCG